MKLEGFVESVYAGGQESVTKNQKPSIAVHFDGIEGDKHRGFTKPADSRNKEYQRGTLMRNDRMWSAVSLEELRIVAEIMKLRELSAGVIGANFSVRGIPSFSQIPKGSKLIFPDQAVLVVEGVNDPCTLAGEEVAKTYGSTSEEQPIKPNIFPKAAWGKRGIIGIVEREGTIRAGDAMTVQAYQPKTYSLPERKE